MGTSKKRNKRYKPKPAYVDSFSLAISGSKTLRQDQITDIYSVVAKSFKGMVEEGITEYRYTVLADGLNTAEALSFLDIGTNLLEDIQIAQESLHQVCNRFLKGQEGAISSTEMETIQYGLDLFEIQLGICTCKELQTAIESIPRLRSHPKAYKIGWSL